MSNVTAPSRATPTTHQRNAEKLARIPIKVEPRGSVLRKPEWIRVKLIGNEDITHIKKHCVRINYIVFVKKRLVQT